MNTTITFETTPADCQLISRIAKRAHRLAAAHDVEYSTIEADMDITACHANGNPLDLDALLTADSFNFAHDVFGIRRHLNRTTAKLEDCFVPRFSAK